MSRGRAAAVCARGGRGVRGARRLRGSPASVPAVRGRGAVIHYSWGDRRREAGSLAQDHSVLAETSGQEGRSHGPWLRGAGQRSAPRPGVPPAPRAGRRGGSAGALCKPQVSVLPPRGGRWENGDKSVSEEAFEAAFWSQGRGHLCAGPKRQALHCGASRSFSQGPQSDGGFGRRPQIHQSPHLDLLGPDHWHQHYPIAKGNNQSPIELHTKDIKHDPSLLPFSVSYDPGSCKTILNNGKTCRVVFDDTFDRSSKYDLWVEHMGVSKSLLTKVTMGNRDTSSLKMETTLDFALVVRIVFMHRRSMSQSGPALVTLLL